MVPRETGAAWRQQCGRSGERSRLQRRRLI